MNVKWPMWGKKIEIPIPEAKKQIDAIQLWEVRWQSRNGPYSGDIQEEVEIFVTPEGAGEFAEALKNSFKLIKHSHGNKIVVQERK